MSDKRYHVIFTGELMPGMDRKTVLSNLVLGVGISEVKANDLLGRVDVMLKRYGSSADAKRLVDKFQQAGAVCHIVDRGENYAGNADSQSALVSIFKRFVRTPG
ncbi:MAG TPA: hypothetical protein VGE50_10710 [Gammaproteobacteria bacterium]